MSAMTPKLGQTVVYVVTEEEARSINTVRAQSANRLRGNSVWRGDRFAATVVRVFDGNPDSRANLQVLLDGNDALWATSVPHGAGEGHWTLAE